jgi:hypothetical protein
VRQTNSERDSETERIKRENKDRWTDGKVDRWKDGNMER